MTLRKLELKDATLMLEWMHDKSVVEDLRTDFMSKTIEDCERFIVRSWNDIKNWNMAISDDANNYMGTVSLKNIKEGSAEFGITVRKVAMGKGIAIDAMREAIRIGFEEKGIRKIYWCVSPENKRAVHFYEKHGFKKANARNLNMIEGYSKEQIDEYIWYHVEKID